MPWMPTATSPSAMPCTSKGCKPQNSATCSKDRLELSISQTAVAFGMSGSDIRKSSFDPTRRLSRARPAALFRNAAWEYSQYRVPPSGNKARRRPPGRFPRVDHKRLPGKHLVEGPHNLADVRSEERR